jgi:hypothetical protein
MREGLDGRSNFEIELLDTPRCPDGPAAVPKVPLEFADDRAGCEAAELDAALRIEAID